MKEDKHMEKQLQMSFYIFKNKKMPDLYDSVAIQYIIQQKRWNSEEADVFWLILSVMRSKLSFAHFQDAFF